MGRAAALGLTVGLALGCGERGHPVDALRQPGGMALSPRGQTLFVALGNWDQAYTGGALVGLDVDALQTALDGVDPAAPCTRALHSGPATCDAAALLRPEVGLRIPSGPVNVATSRALIGTGSGGASRLLIPTRFDPGLTWIDVIESPDGALKLRCDQGADGLCGPAHRIDGIAEDPARVHVDSGGHAFAYLPHLLERGADECEDTDDPACSGITLFRLDGDAGPQLADTVRNFFTEDPLHDSGLRGGFAVAQYPCDAARPPSASKECRRPFLYATQRFWFGLRMFSVAPGIDEMIGDQSVELTTASTPAAPLPLMGDLGFEDASGERLLVVHTTPPALARINTRLDDDGLPSNLPMNTLALCANPNLLEIDQARALAFVTCRSANELAIVDLVGFDLIRTIPLGDGPNEMLLDPERSWLYVANDRGDSISVIELDETSPRYLAELARVANPE